MSILLESLIGKQRQCPMHNFCDFFPHYGEKRGNSDAPHWAFGGGHGLCLALQREVVTLAGRSLEPQEVPLRGFAGVAPELVLAWAGVLLLAGIPPEKLPASRA